MASDLFTQKISFIGGGNMAAAIISGLLSKSFPAKHITVSEPWDVNRNKIAALGVNTTTDNNTAAQAGDLIILAIKPQVAKTVCQELVKADAFASSSSILISIAAGITAASLSEWTGGKVPVVRVMPNTPALLGEGASGVYATKDVSGKQRELVTQLLASVSKVIEWVDSEPLLDVVTGLSGSGPAYFFAMVEHLVSSGVALGLTKAQATKLAAQTCLGAGRMMSQEGAESPAQLRQNVTSPNGTTQAGLESLEKGGFKSLVESAVKAATDRGEELGRTLGAQ